VTVSIDLYVSYRSPYSFFMAARLRPLTESHDLRVVMRPVLPLILRYPDALADQNPALGRYFEIDVARTAAFLGLPYTAAPDPDPVATDESGLRPAADQPVIHRITRLGLAAEKRGGGLRFYEEYGRLLWAGEAWIEDGRLAGAAARAGLDFAVLETDIAANGTADGAEIEENARALEASGHWGTPTCVLEGEPFFGQDRYDQLVWRLEQRGLRQR
jgi:2-hydroxychromene-2-carboxylate isomerase